MLFTPENIKSPYTQADTTALMIADALKANRIILAGCSRKLRVPKSFGLSLAKKYVHCYFQVLEHTHAQHKYMGFWQIGDYLNSMMPHAAGLGGLSADKNNGVRIPADAHAVLLGNAGLLTYPLIIGAVAYWATGSKRSAIKWGVGSAVVPLVIAGGVGYLIYKKMKSLPPEL